MPCHAIPAVHTAVPAAAVLRTGTGAAAHKQFTASSFNPDTPHVPIRPPSRLPSCRYGVPACAADAFEELVLEETYGPVVKAERQAGASEEAARDRGLAALLNKTTVLCPKHLMERGAALLGLLGVVLLLVVVFTGPCLASARKGPRQG